MDAYAKSTTPPELRDLQSTPRWCFEAICSAIGVRPTWDVAAERATSVAGPGRFWDAADNSLAIDWELELDAERRLDPDIGFVVWMNPPYSDPGPWCEKAASEAAKGLIVVGLLPDDRSTDWYQRHIFGVASAVFLPPSRIQFDSPHRAPGSGSNPKGSIIPIWTPWRTGHTQDAYIDRQLWASFRPNRKRARQAPAVACTGCGPAEAAS